MMNLARNEFIKLTKSQEQDIIRIYSESANELLSEFNKTNTELSKRFMQQRAISLYQSIEKIIEQGITESSQIASNLHSNILDSISYKKGVTNSFRTMFTGIDDEVLKALRFGKIYEGGRGLSSRVWYSVNSGNDTIQDIISKGLAKGTRADELAKLLEGYVNPTKRKYWKKAREKLGPSYGGKKIEYNSLRLARTSRSHAYTLSTKLSSKKNPFIDSIQWSSALIHGRTCDLCRDRHLSIYTIDNLPYDHPNGLCDQRPVLENDLDYYSNRIKDWIDGDNDILLNNWYDKYKDELDKILPKSFKINPKSLKDNRYTKILRAGEHKDIGKAIKYMKDKYDIEIKGYNKTNLDTINVVNKNIEESIEQLPILKDCVNKIYYKELRKRVYANAGHDYININTKYFNDLDKLKRFYMDDVAYKFSPKGTKFDSIVTHEMFHNLEDNLYKDFIEVLYDTKTLDKIDRYRQIKSDYNYISKLIKRRTKMRVRKEFGIKYTNKDLKDLLSEYSITNTNEFFAEAGAEMLCSDNPREIARCFREELKLLIEELNSLKGGG